MIFQETPVAVPMLAISADVKVAVLMISEKVSVKLTATDLVLEAWPAARTNDVMVGATLSFVYVTMLVQVDVLLTESTPFA